MINENIEYCKNKLKEIYPNANEYAIKFLSIFILLHLTTIELQKVMNKESHNRK